MFDCSIRVYQYGTLEVGRAYAPLGSALSIYTTDDLYRISRHSLTTFLVTCPSPTVKFQMHTRSFSHIRTCIMTGANGIIIIVNKNT